MSPVNVTLLSFLVLGFFTLISCFNLGIVSKNRLRYRFSIANPLRDSIWRYFIIIISVIAWTIIVILIVNIKVKKDRIILEDALLEKTSRLNQIEKSKYGLVDENEI